MAMLDAYKEELWHRGIMEDLGYEEETLQLYYDNMGAGCLSKGEGLPQHTQHIDVRHHCIQYCIK